MGSALSKDHPRLKSVGTSSVMQKIGIAKIPAQLKKSYESITQIVGKKNPLTHTNIPKFAIFQTPL